MKVVEKLFTQYLVTDHFPATKHYMAARRVLAITENKDLLEEAEKLQKKVHPKLPISLFRVEHFLSSNSTTIEFIKDSRTYKKKRHQIIDYLGEFSIEIDRLVVEAVKIYNTNRAKNTGEEYDEALEDLELD